MAPPVLAQIFLVLISLTAVAMCALAGMRSYRLTQHDRLRFKLFAQRDKLARLALDGKIDQDSPLFTGLLTLINATLHDTERMGFAHFAALVEAMTSGNEFERKKLERLLRKLEPAAATEWARIAIDTLDVMAEILQFNSRLVRWAMKRSAAQSSAAEQPKPTQAAAGGLVPRWEARPAVAAARYIKDARSAVPYAAAGC
jgi:hypothetical protein